MLEYGFLDNLNILKDKQEEFTAGILGVFDSYFMTYYTCCIRYDKGHIDNYRRDIMSETKLGLSENIVGLLAYILGWISGIILLLIEKENKFVRFHAAQSTVLYLGLFVFNIVIGFLTGIDYIGFLFALISMLISLLSLVLWLFLMFKAYKGEMYRLPVIAEYADQLEQKF